MDRGDAKLSVHPFSKLLSLLLVRFAGVMEPIPADNVGESGIHPGHMQTIQDLHTIHTYGQFRLHICLHS